VCYSHRSTSRPNHTQTVLNGAGGLECLGQPSEAVADDALMKLTSVFYTNRAMTISTLPNPMKVLSSICCTQVVCGLPVQPQLNEKRLARRKMELGIIGGR
jgi:hypothetical protein